MQVEVSLQNGLLPDKYDKHTAEEFKDNGRPFVSFPFDIKNVPADTKSIAFALTDLDSIPVCGFEWIHWIAAGLDPKDISVPENAGKENPLKWIKGNNSLAGKLMNLGNDPMSKGYVGPTPPDKPHDYTFTVYALDAKLALKDGFWYNELLHAMKNHIIEQTAVNLHVNN